MSIGLYAKAISAAVGATTVAAITALQNGHVVPLEWVAVAVTFFVNLAAVWAVPNTDLGIARYGKAITAGILAALGALGAGMADGAVTNNEWVIILLALINGLLVAAYPNAELSDEFKSAA